MQSVLGYSAVLSVGIGQGFAQGLG